MKDNSCLYTKLHWLYNWEGTNIILELLWFWRGVGEKLEWLEKPVSARAQTWGHSLMLTVWKVMEWDHVNAVIRFIFPAYGP